MKKSYLAGAAVFLIAAVFSRGYHHFDEHFQILEFAALKLGLATPHQMPWEYFYQMRPALQPVMVFTFYRFVELFAAPDPFLITTFFRVLSAMLSFYSIIFFIKSFSAEINSEKLHRVFAPASLLLWFVVYLSVRFSSENWSGNFFLIALCLIANNKHHSCGQYLWAGLLLGFAFLLRYQSGFLIAGITAWLLLIRKEKVWQTGALLLSVVLLCGLGVVIDSWFYGERTFTAWNYFEQNIIENKAASFGVEPWWYYLQQITLSAIPPFSIVLLVGVVTFFVIRPAHIVTFSLVPFLLVHFIIGHKELRFLFPVVVYIPFMLLIVWDKYGKQKLSGISGKAVQLFFKLCIALNAALVIVVMFRPADSLTPLYEKLYDDYQVPATLYYTESNPYFRVLNINFYKRQNLAVVKINSAKEITSMPGKQVLYATEYPEELSSAHEKWRLVYSTLPQWLKKFNFNHWQERSHFVYVYELQTK